MATRARKSGDEYILNGEKMWITSGSIADVAVVWAKLDGEDGGDAVRGFLVERDRPGFSASDIHGKWSLRASVTSGLSHEGRARSRGQYAAGAAGLKCPLMCLNQARYGISLGRNWRGDGMLRPHCNIPRSESNFTISPLRPINWCRKSWCG